MLWAAQLVQGVDDLVWPDLGIAERPLTTTVHRPSVPDERPGLPRWTVSAEGVLVGRAQGTSTMRIGSPIFFSSWATASAASARGRVP
jgi:hypothetical protein